MKYEFKNLRYNGECVWLKEKGPLFNFYKPQQCTVCNFKTVGYYNNERNIQSFECPKCFHEWDIVMDPNCNRTDKVEELLYTIDNALEKLKEL